MKTTVRLTALIGALACFAAFGQEHSKKKEAPGPPMPKPAAEMKDLRDMVGTWKTEEKFDPSPMMPSGGTATGVNTVRPGPGGFSVLMDQKSKSSMGEFVGHGVLTWDPNEKVYRTTWIDSMTPGSVTTTGRKQGDKLVYTGEAMMMGKKISIKDVISDRTATSYLMTSYMNDGSGEKRTMVIKFTKQ